MTIKHSMSVLILSVLTGSVHAASVIYLIEGGVYKSGGSPGSTDHYQLDGANFSWIFEFDADSYTDRSSCCSPQIITTIFSSTAEHIVFDRAGGLDDLVTAMPVGQLGGDSTMRDVEQQQGQVSDRVTFQGNLAEDLPGLEFNGVGLNFSEDFLNGDLTFPRNLTLSDAETFDFGGSSSFRYSENGTVDEYTVNNLSLTMIPIPAAVWLFGSALGLLGWLRRKPTH